MTVETSAATESELEHERGLHGTITVQGPADISLVSVSNTRGGGQGEPGTPQFLEQRKLVRFQQTHNQGLRQLFLTVSWDLRA